MLMLEWFYNRTRLLGGQKMSEDNLIIKIETEEYIYWEYTEA